MRKIAHTSGEEDGSFDTIHVRRGDFQFQAMWVSADQIYELNARKMIEDGRTIFVATDEKDRSFFASLAKHHRLYFLDDFVHLLGGLDSHFLGMVDQLVAAKGETFIGTYYSTFSGYINRLRGYHAQYRKPAGWEEGIVDSYYYAPQSHASIRKSMRQYHAVDPPFWHREFPIAWRDIDHDVDMLPDSPIP
jgi:hypothetical protein